MGTTGIWNTLQATSSNATKMLGIALGSTITTGVLLRGFVFSSTHYPVWNDGIPLYASETTAGDIESSVPANTGDYVRLVGHATNTSYIIYFNPENTWIVSS
jgi:hypothetical protein